MSLLPQTPADFEKLLSAVNIRRAVLLVAISSSLFSLVVLYFSKDTPDFAAIVLYPALMLAAVGWAGVVFGSSFNSTLLALGFIYGLQAISAYSIISYGSIRAVSSQIFLCTVVGAGVFLSRSLFLMVLFSSILTLGCLTYAEIQGWLTLRPLAVSPLSWMVQSILLLCVAGVLLYSRRRTLEAYAKQHLALEENKRLALERDRSLAHFSGIFRTSPNPIVAQSTATGKIIDVNPAFERCFGYAKEEVLGKSDSLLWALPEQRHHHRGQFQEFSRSEAGGIVGLRANGEHFDAYISSELGTAGEDGLVITVITDMTVQNNALKRLKRSEERFAKAFNLSPLNLIITRLRDDAIVEINRTTPQTSGEQNSELQGIPASQAGPWFSKADRDAFFNRLQLEGHLHGVDAVLARPDGSTIEAKVWAEQIEIEEEACVFTCIVDTTDEKRMQALLRNLAQGISGHTAQAFFNALALQMSQALGADKVVIGELADSETINTLSVSTQGSTSPNISFSIRGKLRDRILHQSGPTVFNKKAPEEESVFAIDDPASYESSLFQALHDGEGRPIGLLHVQWIRATTPRADVLALMSLFSSRASSELMRLRGERKIEQLNETLEQRVQDRTAELRKLNAELDSFAYSISHDLKSPLRAIDGFTQMLNERLEGRLDNEEKELMNRVLGATHRMANLMADLLALTRVSQVPMVRERINLSQLAQEVATQMARQHPRPNVQWQIEPEVYGEGDLSLTRKVLEQLIENALKYTRDQAQPRIEFGQVRSQNPADGRPNIFFLRDNGAGFSMDHADKLFKPFQRLHMPSAGFEGTGIGLATVRRIVERHGGTIEGEAKVKEGAEFRFSLAGNGNGHL